MRNVFHIGVPAVLAATAMSQAAVDDHLIVLQIGDGSSALTSAAAPVVLNDFNLATLGRTQHALPTNAESVATMLTMSGQEDHGGNLTISGDGRYLLLPGYRAAVGSANPADQNAASVNRVVGKVSFSDGSWAIDTSTAVTDAYDRTEFAAVASDNGTRYWLGGSGSTAGGVLTTTGGLRYVASTSATTTTNLSQTNTTGGALQPDSLRNVKLMDNQIYVLTASQGSFVDRGMFKTQTPLPTSGAQPLDHYINNIEDTAAMPSPPRGAELQPDKDGKYVPKSDAVFLDLSSDVPGLDVAYTTGGKSDFEKWCKIDGQWLQVAIYDLDGKNGPDIHALAAAVEANGDVSLYASTPSTIYRFGDSTGYLAAQPTWMDPGTYTSITNYADYAVFTADANTTFRGMVLVPEPASFAMLGAIGLLALVRRRRRSAAP